MVLLFGVGASAQCAAGYVERRVLCEFRSSILFFCSSLRHCPANNWWPDCSATDAGTTVPLQWHCTVWRVSHTVQYYTDVSTRQPRSTTTARHRLDNGGLLQSYSHMHSLPVSVRYSISPPVFLFSLLRVTRTGANATACSPCQPGYYCASGSFNVWGAVSGQSAFAVNAVRDSARFRDSPR